MTRSRTHRALAAPLLSLLVLAGGPLAAQQAPPQPPSPPQDQTRTFEGEIEVREAGIVVEPPESDSLRSVAPKDILVFEGGAPRPVIKSEPLRPAGGSAPWSSVVYFDRVLAGPDTVFDSAVALARHVRELAGLGPVEVMVADPAPRVELAATRDERALSSALGTVSQAARKDRQRRAAAAAPPDVATLRRQLDRLVTFAAGRSGSGAGALFVVMDGFVPPPGEADLLSSGTCDDPKPPGTAAAALCEASRALAAYGWVTFAVPLRELPAEREERRTAEMERIRVQAGGSSHTNAAPPVIPMRPSDRGPLRKERVADVFTRPDSAPLLALVQPTAGSVLGVEDQLAPAFDNLARRWRVWYQAPEAVDGKLRTVEVRLPSAMEALRGPRWVRSSTPEDLDAARARLLAGGLAVAGGTLSPTLSLDGSKLVIRLAPGDAAPAGPVRVSLAWDNRSEVKHLVLPDVSLAKGWEHALEIQPPTGARRLAVVVEDLARGRWGGSTADASSGGRL